MRADDDVYINFKALMSLLAAIRSFNQADQPVMHYVGRPGHGSRGEDIGLRAGQYYCMGGPGVLVNTYAIKAFSKAVKTCLGRLETTHEDVEIGRCFTTQGIANCTKSWEIHDKLYHNLKNEGIDSYQLEPATVTYHPLKQAEAMYKMHLKALKNSRHLKVLDLVKVFDKAATTELSSCPRDTSAWDYHFGTSNSDVPKRVKTKTYTFEENLLSYYHRSQPDTELALASLSSHVTSELNAFAWERGRMISYRGFNYGYSGMSYTGCFRGGSMPGRVPYSVDYVLDLLLKHNQFKWKSVSTKVRKHINLSKLFVPGVHTRKLQLLEEERVNLILPLYKKEVAFDRFLSQCQTELSGLNVRLVVVIFDPEGTTGKAITDKLASLSDDLQVW